MCGLHDLIVEKTGKAARELSGTEDGGSTPSDL